MTAPMRRLSVVVLTAVATALPASVAHAYGVSVTDLPELQEATVVSTTAAADASEGTPAGTTIAFRFDEPVATTEPDPSKFVVYNSRGDSSVASQATIQSDTVTALFPEIDTTSKEQALMVAAAKPAAVQDSTGQTSPTGSVGVTRWTSRTASGPQDCLRLRDVKDLRHVNGDTTVRVVFATCRGGWAQHPGGFRLQMVDGRSIRSNRSRTARSFLKSATVVFPGLHYRSHIARLVVGAGAVGDIYDDGTEFEVETFNALQALPISHQGNSVLPDLVSVKLQPNSNSARPDHAVFVFDQKVSHPTARRFRLDDVAKGTAATVLQRDPRRVRVTFGPDAADAATFATVRAEAVPTGEADEVPVPNVLWTSRRTGAYTAGPDVESASYRYEDAADGAVLAADFEVDTAVSDGASAEAFHLYDKVGARYDAQQCNVTNYADPGIRFSVVTCTFPGAPTARTDPFLATVDAGAVHDDASLANPEASLYAYPR